MTELIFYGLIGGLFSLAGGILLLARPLFARRITNILFAFGAGAFISISLLDLLPEAVESVEEPHAVFMATLAGFGVFFALERLLMRHARLTPDHSHRHHEHSEHLGFMTVLADTTHNFLDGVVIAIAYSVNPVLGFPTALAIAAHEVPQEIAEFAILLDRGWSRARIIAVNILSSLVALAGIVLGYFFLPLVAPALPLLLAGAAGVFLYIGASHLIPEIHHRSGHREAYGVLAAFAAGAVIIALIVEMLH